MAKKVLIISSSPRKGGNSDLLCDEFMKGAIEAGNEVEKIFLKDKTVHPLWMQPFFYADFGGKMYAFLFEIFLREAI